MVRAALPRHQADRIRAGALSHVARWVGCSTYPQPPCKATSALGSGTPLSHPVVFQHGLELATPWCRPEPPECLRGPSIRTPILLRPTRLELPLEAN